MMAVELVQPGTKTPDPILTQAVARSCHEAGLVVLTCGTFGNVLRFLPPLVIPDHLLAEGLDLVDEAFAAVSDRGPVGTTA
jgi:4-aminobutyrate aminotransferase/(S)-3-amino-2-methylpropionate transaminase